MEENYLSDPVTLEEQYLKAIAEKQTTGLSDPTTLKEQYLKAIAENRSEGSELPAVTSEDNGSVLQVINGEWNKNGSPYIDDWIPCQVYCGDTIISTLKASYSPSRGVLNISGYIESSNFSSANKGENVMLCSIISGAIKDYSNITKLPQSMCVSCNDLLFLNFSNGTIRFLTATGDDEGMNIIWTVNAIINWTSSELPNDKQIYLSSVNVDGTGKGTWS